MNVRCNRLGEHRGGPEGTATREHLGPQWLRFVPLVALLTAVMTTGCSPGDDGEVAESTTTTEAASPAQLAEAFATAWGQSDRAAMAALSESDIVERALSFGDAVGPVRCSTHQDGQYQCTVATSSGRRAYYLIKPGAERVWWVSEYHEETVGPAFPPALNAELEHGDRVFGVYLAVEGRENSPGPDAKRAMAEAAAVGYDVGLSPDIDCDGGAREQLGLDPARDYSSVVLYFKTRALAQQFVDFFEPGVVGTAAVTLFCLD